MQISRGFRSFNALSGLWFAVLQWKQTIRLHVSKDSAAQRFDFSDKSFFSNTSGHKISLVFKICIKAILADEVLLLFLNLSVFYCILYIFVLLPWTLFLTGKQLKFSCVFFYNPDFKLLQYIVNMHCIKLLKPQQMHIKSFKTSKKQQLSLKVILSSAVISASTDHLNQRSPNFV